MTRDRRGRRRARPTTRSPSSVCVGGGDSHSTAVDGEWSGGLSLCGRLSSGRTGAWSKRGGGGEEEDARHRRRRRRRRTNPNELEEEGGGSRVSLCDEASRRHPRRRRRRRLFGGGGGGGCVDAAAADGGGLDAFVVEVLDPLGEGEDEFLEGHGAVAVPVEFAPSVLVEEDVGAVVVVLALHDRERGAGDRPGALRVEDQVGGDDPVHEVVDVRREAQEHA
mmetsp:Transcript_24808/g.76613  ORF Transcript_24808/g.76613 Transcript_24808/m.76613 type:complete len:222 (-) Transcript_24808:723-1388(-)